MGVNYHLVARKRGKNIVAGLRVNNFTEYELFWFQQNNVFCSFNIIPDVVLMLFNIKLV